MKHEQRATLAIILAFGAGIAFTFATAALFAPMIGWGVGFIAVSFVFLKLSAQQAARLWAEAEMSDPHTLSQLLSESDDE